MKITKQRLKEIIREELYHDDDAMHGAELGVTEPRHEGSTPEERLLNKLLIRSKVDKSGDPQRAAEMLGLGEDEEVVAYLADLMGNPMLDNPNMEEATQSGGKPPKPEEEHSEVSYNPTKETRKTFHKKARQAAKQDIKKGEIEEYNLGFRKDDDLSKTGKEKRGAADPAEEEPLRLSRPEHDPLDRSPAGIRARRRLQGKGIKNYPLDK
jgi:hypothetical protein